MVHPLYAVGAFVCAISALIIHCQVRLHIDRENNMIRAFSRLTAWVTCFCVIDCIWGILASEYVMNDSALFILSTAFHAGAAVTSCFWTDYVLAFLGRDVKNPKLYFIAAYALAAVQIVMLGINFFTNFLFTVNEAGEYQSFMPRRILFILQYITYFAIGFACVFRMVKSMKKSERTNFESVLAFVAAPIGFGVFQLLYPDAPAYSFGYMLGILVIFSFVMSDVMRKNAQMQERMVYEAELKRAKEQAEASNKSKTTFLFNMSHDIRTPMNAIRGYTALGKKHANDPAYTQDCLDKIDKAGQNLLSLINQVLEMSRIESGKATVAENEVDLIERADVLFTVLKANADAKGLTTEMEVKGIRQRNVITDESRLNQIITNILGNAVKYTPEGGKVSFRVSQMNDRADACVYEFVVEDTGIGMSKEFLPHVFDEFSREKSTTVTGIQGTGLGMSIVKQTVTLLGGTIAIQSEPGRGTRVTILLPMRPNDKVTEKKQEETCSFEGERILLVEDNEMNREIACEILTDAGLKVDTAEDGDIAVEKVKNSAGCYAVVLMDVQMPRMDGYEATRHIRALEDPSLSGIPIIAMTANAFEEDRKNAINAGMNEHLAKPIEINKLKQVLSRFLHK